MRKLERGIIPQGGVLLSPKTSIPVCLGGSLKGNAGMSQPDKPSVTEDAWKDMPKGWTPSSRAKFGKSLTGISSEAEAIAKGLEGEAKEAAEAGDDPMPGFVDKCMDRIDGHVDDPGAFCAALKDRLSGTTHWRGKG